MRAPAGRQRFTVLGALNASTHERVRVTNDTYLTACPVGALLRHRAAPQRRVPMTGVLDNARYPPCHLVEARAAARPRALLSLPAYAPN